MVRAAGSRQGTHGFPAEREVPMEELTREGFQQMLDCGTSVRDAPVDDAFRNWGYTPRFLSLSGRPDDPPLAKEIESFARTRLDAGSQQESTSTPINPRAEVLDFQLDTICVPFGGLWGNKAPMSPGGEPGTRLDSNLSEKAHEIQGGPRRTCYRASLQPPFGAVLYKKVACLTKCLYALAFVEFYKLEPVLPFGRNLGRAHRIC